ncbi:MAG: transcription-repair coupling factor [Candidatus Riflebacteria bacterium]|nr:transcription-repair coupling factor [Candidatus Riflebacteria bacterium]NLV93739.1 transcription-repair coupling factor [Candidatus Riflebacteria bacterium]
MQKNIAIDFKRLFVLTFYPKMLFKNINFKEVSDLTGCKGALAAIILAKIARQPGVTLLVTQSPERAKEMHSQILPWLGPQSDRAICMLPERETVYDQTAADPDVLFSRIAAMSLEGRLGGLVIAPVSVLSERFFAPKFWLKECFEIKQGEQIKRSEFIDRLVKIGYKRVATVEEKSTFAVRGSLIDLFPPNSEFPFRLDFFGDDLETIKLFSPQTQRSYDKRDKIYVTPVFEFVTDQDEYSKIEAKVEAEIPTLDERRAGLLERKLEHFRTAPDSRDYKELRPFVHKGDGYVFDFWQDLHIIIDEADQTIQAFDEVFENFERRFEQSQDTTPLKQPHAYYHRPNALIELLNKYKYAKMTAFSPVSNSLFDNLEYLKPPLDSSRETLLKDLRALIEANWSVAIAIEDEGRLNNLRGLLGERKVKIHSSVQPFNLKAGSVLFLKGRAKRGFKDHNQKLAVFAEEDIFMGPARENTAKKRTAAKNLMQIDQMVPGDIVVHSDHGVAEFRGIHTMTAGGNTREYIFLQYAGADKLYVPTDQVHKVSKYLGAEGHIPRVHSLNSKTWVTQKAKVKKNVEYIARELLELYAERIANKGFAFEKDNDMMRQMEDNFPFIETPDQMKAIVAVKEDMESESPMDRLICGDVGYGKTEVAMRAAFKAVCSGKQVAVLAPTTLLAFQHYQSFLKRFEGFPVSVDMISRLRKPAEQKETLAKLKAGTLDVVVGTHRILSSDIRFKDLGLLIVDEEQRFGVKHKEKLKKIKTLVDVLTLTATPIPRTMQMAMSGIRQISIIDTPPKDRRPVNTYVAPFDAGWIKRAIIEELKRGGQIYYVYNRVETIDKKASFLRELVPDARIITAHGQMDENEVEKTMVDFVKREYDILVATTIIESGLDIPNANTLIVDEAERLGLSQMYQLRGRVGRSARQAWAYFFYSKGKRLSKEANDRLETIEEHTALGSGFKIAMRDLQIRGAGNILGETQSGHIASIGLSLYMEMLEDAVVKAKTGNRAYEKVDSAIEIPVTAYFPKTYIPEEETRVELYSRLARCKDLELLSEIKEECEDRFGPLPSEALALYAISRLRVLAVKANVVKVTRVINHLRFEFSKNKLPDIGRVFSTGSDILSGVYFDSFDPNAINLKIDDNATEVIFDNAANLLNIFADSF